MYKLKAKNKIYHIAEFENRNAKLLSKTKIEGQREIMLALHRKLSELNILSEFSANEEKAIVNIFENYEYEITNEEIKVLQNIKEYYYE